MTLELLKGDLRYMRSALICCYTYEVKDIRALKAEIERLTREIALIQARS